MKRKINIGPFTRINGLWHLSVEVEGNQVVDAWSLGTNFRGLELILLGRDPRDAPYLTQRICGICSSAHALNSSLALERAAGLEIPRGGALVKNLIFGADLLQSHLRQLYFLMLPDFFNLPPVNPLGPSYQFPDRLAGKARERVLQNFYQSSGISQELHEVLALFGGKAPHGHGILAGGASVLPGADNIRLASTILSRARDFIRGSLLPDLQELEKAFPEYHEMGKARGDLLSLGLFLDPDNPREAYFPPGVLRGDKEERLDTSMINEQLEYSFYREGGGRHPREGETIPDFREGKPYSWIKAPRYGEDVFEVGPLARQKLLGKESYGISALDRIMARGRECLLVVEQLGDWLAEMQPGEPAYSPYQGPEDARGEGYLDVMRGTLMHSVGIRGGRIVHYQIITPSAWNCSPRDDLGQRGPVEEALVGTYLEDIENPVEIGRVARSFDICGSCAVHMARPGSKNLEPFKIVEV